MIKHKYQSNRPDSDDTGAIQPSHWDADHDVDGMLGALQAIGLAPSTVPYIKSDSTGSSFAITPLTLALMAIADPDVFAAALGVAKLGSPNLTGAPTAPTPALGDNSTLISTTAFVQSAIAALVASSPATLNTLKELADAIGDDPNFAATMTTALGNRLRFDAVQSLTSGQKAQVLSNLGVILGTVAALNVGTGANNIPQLDASGKMPAVDGSALTNVAPTNAVRYDTAQALTVTQKSRARANIDIVGTNRFHNGDFRVDQRGAASGAAVATSQTYLVDRWYAIASGAAITSQRNAGTNGLRYALAFAGAAGNTGLVFGQRIEADAIYDCVNKDMVCTVPQVYSSSIASLTWTAYYASAVDNFTTKTQIATGTLAINGTATDYSFTFNAGASAGNGIAIEFSCGALGAGQSVSFGGAVQLERGLVPTVFEYVPYTVALNRCRRYCWRLASDPIVTNAPFGTGFQYDATRSFVALQFPVEMRAVPSFSLSSVSHFNLWGIPATSIAVSAISSDSASKNAATLLVTVSSGSTGGQGAMLRCNSTSATMTFTSEL